MLHELQSQCIYLAGSSVDDLHLSKSVDGRLSSDGRVYARQSGVSDMNHAVRSQRDGGRHAEGGRPCAGRAAARRGTGRRTWALGPDVVVQSPRRVHEPQPVYPFSITLHQEKIAVRREGKIFHMLQDAVHRGCTDGAFVCGRRGNVGRTEWRSTGNYDDVVVLGQLQDETVIEDV